MTDIYLEGVLLGMRLSAADTVTRTFLAFTSLLWLIAGLFARTYMAGKPRPVSFWSFFLLTLTGNLGVVLAADVASFYFFYALMTYAAYGLVAHERTEASRRAGRVYLAMSLVGEVVLLTAFLLVVRPEINVDLHAVPARVAASPIREALVVLFLAGFGIKAGAIFLHVWLPLAHPVAPTPASAVLSGAMIKCGLLGWLRLLPLGFATMPDAGRACLVGGFAAAFYGVVIGVTQKDPKTILAYSSVSQMGLMTAALGVGLANPGAAGAAVTAILLFATHHALAKGALFLGTGVASATGSGRLALLALVLPALAIAGAPFTSGALAKLSLKALVAQWPEEVRWLPALLSIGAVGSTLLMVAFLRRIVSREDEHAVPRAGLLVPWGVLLLANVGMVAMAPEDLRPLVRPDKVWDAAWPVCVGVGIAAAASRLGRGWANVRAEIPPGDVLCLLEALSRAVRRWVHSKSGALRSARRGEVGAFRSVIQRLSGRVARATRTGEATLYEFESIGILFALLGAALFAAAISAAR
ncbi:MAG: complex I subunit 5 family protein [Myxococcota bacterium]